MKRAIYRRLGKPVIYTSEQLTVIEGPLYDEMNVISFLNELYPGTSLQPASPHYLKRMADAYRRSSELSVFLSPTQAQDNRFRQELAHHDDKTTLETLFQRGWPHRDLMVADDTRTYAYLEIVQPGRGRLTLHPPYEEGHLENLLNMHRILKEPGDAYRRLD